MESIKEFKIDGIDAVYVSGIPKISIFKTFDCGQSFRFEPVSVFGGKYEFGGVANSRYVIFSQDTENEITVYGATREDYLNVWKSFLSLDTDYERINQNILSACKSEDMGKAVLNGDGIRILRQDKWESVCSFIISQNNNIPRIKKIIESLSQKYGKKIEFMGKTYYDFPSAKALDSVSEEEIFALKTGFRARYIKDAAKKVASREVDLESVYNEPDFQKCLEALMQIKGVGLKVASCALLFGFGKTEAFPIDVWMKRALLKYFPDGIDLDALGSDAGIAQQYLFYYEKYIQSP
jgi:N-glycosylase/DNA lyase